MKFQIFIPFCLSLFSSSSIASIHLSNTTSPEHAQLANSSQIETNKVDSSDEKKMYINAWTENRKKFAKLNIWPNKTVVYEFHPNLTSVDKSSAITAMNKIEEKTCVRFRTRSPEDEDYVIFKSDNRTFSETIICRKGGPQEIRFNSGPASLDPIRQLFHALCFYPENERSDRDDFIQFGNCESRPPIIYFDTRGQLYDYKSITHPPCGTCAGGWPRIEGFWKCGPTSSELSMMDVEKINDLYGCQGCHTHRWINIKDLTKSQTMDLLFLPPRNEFHFVCRGYLKGRLVVGRFNVGLMNCHVNNFGQEFMLSKRAQVLLIHEREELSRVDYEMTEISSKLKDQQGLIPAALNSNGEVGYVANALVNLVGSGMEIDFRTWWPDDDLVEISKQGRIVKSTVFGVLACMPKEIDGGKNDTKLE